MFWSKLLQDLVEFPAILKAGILNVTHSVHSFFVSDLFFEIVDLFILKFPYRVKVEFEIILQQQQAGSVFIFTVVFGIIFLYFIHLKFLCPCQKTNIASLEGCFEQYVELVQTEDYLLVNGATFCTSDNKRFVMNFIFPLGNLSNNVLDFINSYTKGTFFVDKESNFFRVWAYVFPNTPARTSLPALLKPEKQNSSGFSNFLGFFMCFFFGFFMVIASVIAAMFGNTNAAYEAKTAFDSLERPKAKGQSDFLGYLMPLFSFLFVFFIIFPTGRDPIVLAIKWSLLILCFCLFLLRRKVKKIRQKNLETQKQDFEERLKLLDKYNILLPLI